MASQVGRLLRRGAPLRRAAPHPRAWRPFATSKEQIIADAEAFVVHVGQVREGRTYSAAVARGVVASLADPSSGVPVTSLDAFLRTLAGSYEIGEDNGLDALASAVERQIAQDEGKRKVTCVVSAGGATFDVEAFEGTSLYDVVERGEGPGAELLREYIECACSGVMACSTCHVVVDGADFDKVGEPCDAELDMLDLAFDPQPTSRLGCQLTLSRDLDGLRLAIPDDAHNLMDDIPFDDAR